MAVNVTGFVDESDKQRHIANVDMSNDTARRLYQDWLRYDGTKDGILKLPQKGKAKAPSLTGLLPPRQTAAPESATRHLSRKGGEYKHGDSQEPTGDQYKLELQGGSVEIMADNDNQAKAKALTYIAQNSIGTANLHLFRYPKDWATKGGELIEVPFLYAV